MIEPILIKAGDDRILVKGSPLEVDCRVIAEDNYQELKFLASSSVVSSALADLYSKLLLGAVNAKDPKLFITETIKSHAAQMKGGPK